MDSQKDNTTSQKDNTTSQKDIILPKLIRDNITNYQIRDAVNESVDEYHEQMMDMIINLQRNPNGGNIKLLRVCNGYDLHDGKKKYCKKYECTNKSSRMNRNMYICEYCQNPKTCYCEEHVQGNLYRAIYEISNHKHYVTTCDDCYQYKLEELHELQKSAKYNKITTLTKEDIIPTSV
jgi:hypothetical protein